MITQIILALWLVLAYDLLEDRRTIDVILTKSFPLCVKMAESFENLGNILHDWAKDNTKKHLVEALNRYEKQEEEKKSFRFLENDSEKNTRAVSDGSRARLNQTQNWS